MIKNKEIEIRIENEAEIEAMLAKVNGRAKTHTFTTFGELLRLSCRVSTGWMSYNYLKSQYLLEGCKSEILEFLQPD